MACNCFLSLSTETLCKDVLLPLENWGLAGIHAKSVGDVELCVFVSEVDECSGNFCKVVVCMRVCVCLSACWDHRPCCSDPG